MGLSYRKNEQFRILERSPFKGKFSGSSVFIQQREMRDMKAEKKPQTLTVSF